MEEKIKEIKEVINKVINNWQNRYRGYWYYYFHSDIERQKILDELANLITDEIKNLIKDKKKE